MSSKKLFILVVTSGLISASISQSDAQELAEYRQAVTYYKAKDYFQAAQLLEEILPLLRGTVEEASAYFYQAYCSFHLQGYEESAERFGRFYKTFLLDPRREEALYRQGHGYYCSSPDVNLEQVATQKSIAIFEQYLQQYPEGAYLDEVQQQLVAMRHKLAHKELEIAKLYYKIGKCQAALVVLKNLEKDFPNTPYNQEAAYLKVQAQYRCIKEVEEKERKEQLNMAIQHCQYFLTTYPDSPNASAVQAIYHELTASK